MNGPRGIFVFTSTTQKHRQSNTLMDSTGNVPAFIKLPPLTTVLVRPVVEGRCCRNDKPPTESSSSTYISNVDVKKWNKITLLMATHQWSPHYYLLTFWPSESLWLNQCTNEKVSAGYWHTVTANVEQSRESVIKSKWSSFAGNISP